MRRPGEIFPHIARATSSIIGQWQTFVAAVTFVVAWIIGGFWVGFSDPVYQLWINTTTSVMTFLIVFLIQNSQNRDTLAIHLKLDELILVTAKARNELAAVELLSEEEIRILRSGGPGQ